MLVVTLRNGRKERMKRSLAREVKDQKSCTDVERRSQSLDAVEYVIHDVYEMWIELKQWYHKVHTFDWSRCECHPSRRKRFLLP